MGVRRWSGEARMTAADHGLQRLLAVCVVTVLVQACFGPPPPPTPDGVNPYAPEQLGLVLPDEVNGRTMLIGDFKPDEAETMFAQAPEPFQRYVLSIGKAATDVVGATAQSDREELPDGRSSGVYIIALRVRGVLANQVMAGFVENTTPEPTLTQETVAGKQVYAVVRGTEAPDPLYLYPVGEVLFVVGATPADIATSETDARAALAALP